MILGEMRERFNRNAWKAFVVVRQPGVRIPLSPPSPRNPILDFSFKITHTTVTMKSFSLRFLIGFILSLIILLSFSTKNHAFAQTVSSNPYTNLNTNPDVPKDFHTLTQSVMIEVLSAGVCQLTGIDVVHPQQGCLGIDPNTGKIGFATGNTGGAIGMVGNLIGMTVQKPLGTSDYVAYVSQNFITHHNAYAATPAESGTGYQGLTPLVNIWAAFRNVVYLLFVLVFIVIGFAVMFRVQIDPRTVMTLENQLPKIIIGLILVTFSFAIAGLAVDAMWVLTYAIINLISSADPALAGHAGKISDHLIDNPWGFLDAVMSGINIGGLWGLALSAGRAIQEVLNGTLTNSDLVSAIITPLRAGEAAAQTCDFGCKVGNIVKDTMIHTLFPPAGFWYDATTGAGQAVGTAIANGIGFFVSWIVGFLAIFIIAIAVIITLFRIWFMLLKAYAFILLDVILAPFWIVLGLFPGSPIGFGAWLKDLCANLIAFPITVGLFVLARIFMDISNSTAGGNLFFPPLIANPNHHILYGQTGSINNPIIALLGLSILFIATEAVQIAQDALKAQPNKYSAAVGKNFGRGNPLSAVTGAGQAGYTLSGLQTLGKGAKGFFGKI